MTQNHLHPEDEIIIYNGPIGEDIGIVSEKTIKLAQTNRTRVSFHINGVDVVVEGSEEPEEVIQKHNKGVEEKLQEYRRKAAIFPASPEGIAAAAAEKQKLIQEQRNAEIAQILASTEIEFADKAKWDYAIETNKDNPLTYGIKNYAERWAKLMQAEIEYGNKIADIADRTSVEANYNGITNPMYYYSISLLSATWKHGPELRQWHNQELDKKNNNDGVVKPAIAALKM